MMAGEYCGVIAAAGGEVNLILYNGLWIIQHRGQESAGIATFTDRLLLKKGSGLIHEAISPRDVEALSATRGIGHVRYSTLGGQDRECQQPMTVRARFGEMALAHNGEIVNSSMLREGLFSGGWGFVTDSDSEVILRLLSVKMASTGDIVSGIREAMKELVGSYSLALMVGPRVFAVRDPLAIRPLCLGRVGDVHCAASESVAFDSLGGEFIRDLLPGEIVELTDKGFVTHSQICEPPTAHCMFEWVYFSRPDSYVDGKLVYDVRRKMGIRLAQESPVEADFVVPIPDSGRALAIGYSEASGIPHAEGLIKNRYVQRTFIMPDQKDRISSMALKLNPLKPVVDGKRIILVDDSIVRGTTMKQIIKIVRKAGAREVHLRIGCPPIVSPCYLGVDMKEKKDFVAHGRDIGAIREYLGADSLAYASMDNLLASIGKNRNELCLGCITGEYPLPVPDGE
ncbi:MAG: amidophosphoribosyltransferase [Thermoplasmata archaeon]